MTDQTPYADGHGIDTETAAIVKERDLLVHLRLSYPDRRYPTVACDPDRTRFLGAVWTGLPDEVTCPDCKDTAS